MNAHSVVLSFSLKWKKLQRKLNPQSYWTVEFCNSSVSFNRLVSLNSDHCTLCVGISVKSFLLDTILPLLLVFEKWPLNFYVIHFDPTTNLEITNWISAFKNYDHCTLCVGISVKSYLLDTILPLILVFEKLPLNLYVVQIFKIFYLAHQIQQPIFKLRNELVSLNSNHCTSCVRISINFFPLLRHYPSFTTLGKLTILNLRAKQLRLLCK